MSDETQVEPWPELLALAAEYGATVKVSYDHKYRWYMGDLYVGRLKFYGGPERERDKLVGSFRRGLEAGEDAVANSQQVKVWRRNDAVKAALAKAKTRAER